MEIRLDQISDTPYRWDERCEIAAEVLERAQLLELGPISWQGRVERTPDGFVLSAELSYEQILECPRCLGRSSMPVQAGVDMLVRIGGAEPLAGEVELEEADLSVLTLEDEVLDTEPLLLEQIQLNIPMRRLCRDDCKGLCPTCGVDRNLESCDCETESVDPRWQGLAGLRERLDT